MKVHLQPLYSQLNGGIGGCKLGCQQRCKVHQLAPSLKPPPGYSCPLSSHQVETYAATTAGNADLIFNTSATGDGKSLAASLPSLLEPSFRWMGLYPTIELVTDQTRQQQSYHDLFGLDSEGRIEQLFGAKLSSLVTKNQSNRFVELLLMIQTKPVLLTNPDIFHLITHYQYKDPARDRAQLPLSLAEFPDLWVFDEFHIFGPHQEAAVLNSMTLIRRTQQKSRRFLFTCATPKPEFIEQLKQANFRVVEVEGKYANQATSGYRQILQAVELNLIDLRKNNAESWLRENYLQIAQILQAEGQGRGLIILNSVAMARKVAGALQELLPQVEVREISGRIDRQERTDTQDLLQNAPQPVLVVATSAVDVGVDFRIHLLIFETSNSATVIQRLGRLGRHSGFNTYRAFMLIPGGRTPWVMRCLEEKLASVEIISRQDFQAVIEDTGDSPRNFPEYRHRWGALQAQGMFFSMMQEKGTAKISQQVRERMAEDLQSVYGNKLDCARKQWCALGNHEVGKATQKELLRFRGSSSLQAAVWEKDTQRFYTYDLLKLLPYAIVNILDRETFLNAATVAGHTKEEFPDKYLQIYLQVEQWLDERLNLSLHTNTLTNDLKVGELYLLQSLTIEGHFQSEVTTCLGRKKLLAFLVPVNRSNSNSHWDVSRKLHLSPLFGLHRLSDHGRQAYACAFNQDALLLDALNWRLKDCYRSQPKFSIF